MGRVIALGANIADHAIPHDQETIGGRAVKKRDAPTPNKLLDMQEILKLAGKIQSSIAWGAIPPRPLTSANLMLVLSR